MAFAFDDTKSFEENLNGFLNHMEAEDPTLGAILRANSFELAKLADEAKRRVARTEFNDSVKAALNELMNPSKEGETQ